MNEQATGAMPDFMQQPAAPPARQPRQRRQRAAPAEPAAEPAPKKTRKPRGAKAERAAPETIKVTLKEFAAMRVGEENAKTFIKAHGLLSELGKAARVKVLGELQKVLG